MDNTFLDYVAADLLKKYGTNLSRIAVVFPNKRASLFLNDSLIRQVDAPIWTPAYFTISQLFRQGSPLTVGDPIKLICDLHKSFIKCTGIDESIDHFYGWGQLLISDFDDIDKNMADAEQVFRNIENLHELDDTSYLTAEQRDVLRKFFSNFADNDTELKKRFISLWKHFASIYTDFNKRLTAQGLAYEGALYRKVATDESVTFSYDTYVFVGFNMLHEVEKRLFKTLKEQGKAKFYWDYDRYYMPRKEQPENEAGHFIAQYLDTFPNELDNSDGALYDNISRIRDISYVSASTDTVQTAYMTQWLRQQHRIEAGKRTAIVMCDESILQNVIHALPAEVKKANITTGFPLQQTAITSFVSLLVGLQTTGYLKKQKAFRLHSVLRLLRHPYTTMLSAQAEPLAKKLLDEKNYFPNSEALGADATLASLFKPIAEQNGQDATSYNAHLFEWIQQILKLMGTTIQHDDALFAESLFRMYTLTNRLLGLMKDGDLDADLSTVQRLYSQLIASTSIPFHGEPIQGIQVMGVLETRNLDFDHLLILSCNEGKMPKNVNDASFIPYSIRKAYGLTTIDHKVAIYAYYFNRLIQRARHLTIVYTTNTDDMKVGEKSRFMSQLMVESGLNIQHYTLQAEHSAIPQEEVTIDKCVKVMQALNAQQRLSPTAINKYLRCPLLFYYYHIGHIHEFMEEEELDMDHRTFGNVFHKAAETLYKMIADEKGQVYASSIEAVQKNTRLIEQTVDDAFQEELFKADNTRRRPDYNGLQLINRAVIIRYVKNMLELDRKHTPFRILGLEIPVYSQFEVSINGSRRSIEVGGYIDRLDSVVDKDTQKEMIRVVDYKTGKEASAVIKDIDGVFARKDIERLHSNYYLQSMLYSLLVAHNDTLNPRHLPVSPALLFIQHAQRPDYDPVLTFTKGQRKDKETVRITDITQYEDDFRAHLSAILSEILDPSHPFMKTYDSNNCTHCPYKELCKINRF